MAETGRMPRASFVSKHPESGHCYKFESSLTKGGDCTEIFGICYASEFGGICCFTAVECIGIMDDCASVREVLLRAQSAVRVTNIVAPF